jgi:lysine 6-dehydrogenase
VVSTRVFLLGGAGYVGMMTAKRLVNHPKVSEVAIAGRNVERAKQGASEIGDKASYARVDAMDTAALAREIRGYDVLVNAAGPDYLIQPRAVRAAIEAGVHCCDIAADGPSTEDVLGLNERAEDLGIAAIIGMGSCPGISNLMMMHAASQFDEVDEVHFHCTLPLGFFIEPMPRNDPPVLDESEQVSASLESVMKWHASPARVFRAGRLTDVDPFDSGTVVTLPSGHTPTAYPVNTVEPITIPRQLNAVKNVSVLVCTVPSPLIELMRRLSKDITAQRKDSREAALAFVKEVKEDQGRWLANPEDYPLEFIMWATATGVKNGERGVYTMVQGKEWLSTAAPLSLATLKLLTGQMRKRGVLPPEACFEPMPFMKEVARCVLSEASKTVLFDESFKELD